MRNQLSVNALYDFTISDFIIYIIGKTAWLGNFIFIITSSIFLIDDNDVKPKKLTYLIFYEHLICLLIFISIIIINKIVGYKIFDQMGLNTLCFPQFKRNWWFIAEYVKYYLIHGILNNALKNISNKLNLIVFAILLSLLCILPLITHIDPDNRLFFFILIHSIVYFIKKYNFSEFFSNKKMLIFSLILLMIYIITSYNLGARNEKLFGNFVIHYTKADPFLFLFAFALCFNMMNINFYNKFINMLSSLSFLIFMLSDANPIINGVIKNYKESTFKFPFNDLINLLIISIIVYIFCVIFSYFIKIIFDRPIKFLSDKIFE